MYKVIKSDQVVMESGKVELYKKAEPTPVQEPTTLRPEVQDVSETDANRQMDRILEQARERARDSAARILEDAYAQRDRIINTAAREAERMKEAACAAGHADGMAAAADELSDRLRAMDAAVAEIHTENQQRLKVLEDRMINMALEVASRIMSHSIELDETQMMDLVLEAVRQEKDKKKINVHISKQMLTLADALDRALEPLREKYQSTIKVVPDNLPDSGCRIETEDGIIDASLFVQLDNLKRQLRILDTDELLEQAVK